MKDLAEALPGIERIKLRFLSLLEERQAVIALHTLAAWDSKHSQERRDHLEVAQNTLHQIAGSAGSLGFDELGQTASDCESEIVSHLQDPESDRLPLPAEIMGRIDGFISMSESLLIERA